jgi:hypothetical protein
MRWASRCGSAVTVALYGGCLLLIAAGSGSSLVGAVGVRGWVTAMALAFVTLALGGVALASEGRAARRAAGAALAVLAAGIVVSLLLLSAMPNQN